MLNANAKYDGTTERNYAWIWRNKQQYNKHTNAAGCCLTGTNGNGLNDIGSNMCF